MSATRLTLVLAVLALLAGGCPGSRAYGRDPYPDGRRIDGGLAHVERQFVEQLADGRAGQILLSRTAPPWRGSMAHFLSGYVRHPVRIARMDAGDDATAREYLDITCAPGRTQRVELWWAWFDDAWRAWPGQRETAGGRFVPYPGCG